jgi:hypothetical protein
MFHGVAMDDARDGAAARAHCESRRAHVMKQAEFAG